MLITAKTVHKKYDFKFKNNCNIYVWGPEDNKVDMFTVKCLFCLKWQMYLYCPYASFIILGCVGNEALICYRAPLKIAEEVFQDMSQSNLT